MAKCATCSETFIERLGDKGYYRFSFEKELPVTKTVARIELELITGQHITPVSKLRKGQFLCPKCWSLLNIFSKGRHARNEFLDRTLNSSYLADRNPSTDSLTVSSSKTLVKRPRSTLQTELQEQEFDPKRPRHSDTYGSEQQILLKIPLDSSLQGASGVEQLPRDHGTVLTPETLSPLTPQKSTSDKSAEVTAVNENKPKVGQKPAMAKKTKYGKKKRTGWYARRSRKPAENFFAKSTEARKPVTTDSVADSKHSDADTESASETEDAEGIQEEFKKEPNLESEKKNNDPTNAADHAYAEGTKKAQNAFLKSVALKCLIPKTTNKNETIPAVGTHPTWTNLLKAEKSWTSAETEYLQKYVQEHPKGSLSFESYWKKCAEVMNAQFLDRTRTWRSCNLMSVFLNDNGDVSFTCIEPQSPEPPKPGFVHVGTQTAVSFPVNAWSEDYEFSNLVYIEQQKKLKEGVSKGAELLHDVAQKRQQYHTDLKQRERMYLKDLLTAVPTRRLGGLKDFEELVPVIGCIYGLLMKQRSQELSRLNSVLSLALTRELTIQKLVWPLKKISIPPWLVAVMANNENDMRRGTKRKITANLSFPNPSSVTTNNTEPKLPMDTPSQDKTLLDTQSQAQMIEIIYPVHACTGSSKANTEKDIESIKGSSKTNTKENIESTEASTKTNIEEDIESLKKITQASANIPLLAILSVDISKTNSKQPENKTVDKNPCSTPTLVHLLKITYQLYKFEGSIIYSHNADECNSICQELVSEMCTSKNSAIGFDMKWTMTKEKGKQIRTALIQIAPTTNQCFLFHIACMSKFPQMLENLLKSTVIKKVGLNILHHLWILEQDLGIICRDITGIPFGAIDLQTLANKKLGKSESWTMDLLSKTFLGEALSEDQSVEQWDWSNCTLSQEKQRYAASSVAVSLMTYLKLSKIE